VYRGKQGRAAYQDAAREKELELACEERIRRYKKTIGGIKGAILLLERTQRLDKSRFDSPSEAQEGALGEYAAFVHVVVFQTSALRLASKATVRMLHVLSEAESTEHKEDFRFSASKADQDRVHFAEQWVSTVRINNKGFPYVSNAVIGGTYDGLAPMKAKEAAVVPLQNMYRSKVARQRAGTQRLKNQVRLDMLLEIHLEEMSAIQIQRAFRGFGGRTRLNSLRKIFYRKLYEEVHQEMAHDKRQADPDDIGIADETSEVTSPLRVLGKRKRSEVAYWKGMACLGLVWAPLFVLLSTVFLSAILYAIETDGALKPKAGFESRNVSVSLLAEDIKDALLSSTSYGAEENATSSPYLRPNDCDDTSIFSIRQHMLESGWRRGVKDGHNIWREISYEACFSYTFSKLIGLRIPLDTAFVEQMPPPGDLFSPLAEGIAAHSFSASTIGGLSLNIIFVVVSTCTTSMMSAVAAHLLALGYVNSKPLSSKAQAAHFVHLLLVAVVVLVVLSCLFAVGFWESVDVSREVPLFQYDYFDAFARSFVLLTGNDKPLGMLAWNEATVQSYGQSASGYIGSGLLRVSASYGGFGFTDHKIISVFAAVLGFFAFKIAPHALWLGQVVRVATPAKRVQVVKGLIGFFIVFPVVILGLCSLMGYIFSTVESHSTPLLAPIYNDTACSLAIVDQAVVALVPSQNSTTFLLADLHEQLHTVKPGFWQGFVLSVRTICGPLGPHPYGSIVPYPKGTFSVENDDSQVVVAAMVVVKLVLSGMFTCLLANSTLLVYCVKKLDRRETVDAPKHHNSISTEQANHQNDKIPNMTHVVNVPGNSRHHPAGTTITPFTWGSGTVSFMCTLVVLVPVLCIFAAIVSAGIIVAVEDGPTFQSAFVFSLPVAFGLPGLSSDVSELKFSTDLATGVSIGCAVASFLSLRCLSYAVAFNLSASKWLSNVVVASFKLAAGKCKPSHGDSGVHFELNDSHETRIDVNLPEFTGVTSRLKGLDKLMYILQSDSNPMIVNGFALLQEIPNLEELQETIARMVKYEPRLRSIVDLEGGEWSECTGIQFDQHVKMHGCYGFHNNKPVDFTINDFLKKHGSKPLNTSVPLWEMHVLNMKDHKVRFPKSGMQNDVQCAVFLRIHHVIGDGVSILNLFDQFLSTMSADGVKKEGSLLSIGGRPKRKRSSAFWIAAVFKTVAMVVFVITCWPLWGLFIMLKMAFMRSDPKSVLRPR
jgi:hypothetical protein